MSSQSNDAYDKMFPMTPRGYRFKPMDSEDGAGMRNANSPLFSERRYRHFNDGTGLAVHQMTPAELNSLRMNIRDNNDILRSFDNRIANIKQGIENKKGKKKRNYDPIDNFEQDIIDTIMDLDEEPVKPKKKRKKKKGGSKLKSKKKSVKIKTMRKKMRKTKKRHYK